MPNAPFASSAEIANDGTRLIHQAQAAGPDGRAGWRWVELCSDEALDREGVALNHAMGSYAQEIKAYERSAFSLRDPDGKPQLTLETREGSMLKIKSALGRPTSKAYANPPCPAEFFELVGEFAPAFAAACEARGWTPGTSAEVEAAGLVAIEGVGLGVRGKAPTQSQQDLLSERLVGAEAPQNAAKALGSLAAVGWMEEFEAALPLADSKARADALLRSSRSGNLAAVERLSELAGADFDHGPALREAAGHGRLDVVDFLLTRADPKAISPSSVSPLALAASAGHADVVKRLLPLSDPLAGDSSALLLAASGGHLDVVKLLLPLSDPSARNSEAFHSAKRSGFEEVAELIRVAEAERLMGKLPAEPSVDKLASRRAQAQPAAPSSKPAA